MKNKNVLIVEPRQDIGEQLASELRAQGALVKIIIGTQQGLEQALLGPLDLLILNTPSCHDEGLEICIRLRQCNKQIPILLLLPECTSLERVIGLELGADDCVSKPFCMVELICRTKVLLRRASIMADSSDAKEGGVIQVKGLEIVESSRQVKLSGKEVGLTAKEFDLLRHLVKRPEQVFSRTELLDQVWGYQYKGYEHTVSSHVNRLRSKLEVNPRKPDYIITCWGVGYQFRGPS